MHTIHVHYDIAYEAALEAQIISLQARLEFTKKFILNEGLIMESRITEAQISALQAEVRRLND